MKVLKSITAFILAASMIFLTGCWNYREIESLAIVAGLAIDEAQNDGKYHLTFDLIDLSGGGSSGGVTTPKSKAVETDGKTIFEAIRNAIKICGKRLYFSDCKVVVISQTVAKSGIKPVVDFFSRDSEFRRKVNILITKEKLASAIIKTQPTTDTIVSYEISDMLESDKKSLSKEPVVSLYQADNLISGDSETLILPGIKISPENPTTTQLDGTAIFKGDKLKGFINGDDSQYILFIKNKVKTGLLVLNDEKNKKGITLEITSSKTTVKPEFADDKAKIDINILIKAAVGENETDKDYSSQEGIKSAEEFGERLLKKRIVGIIEKVQNNFDSDIFGFGKDICRTDNEKWEKLKPNWDKDFKTLKYNLNVKIQIINTAALQEEIKAGR
ncbi:MAG TPA: Ger(x)C family spore germination protein [Ruminiclostridium sp.]|nr:Ger(x)C family spore germination protein [Ruminiclostridium sp.]